MNLRINDVLIFLSNQFSVKSEPSINTRAKPTPDDEITKEKDKLENRIMVIKSMMMKLTNGKGQCSKNNNQTRNIILYLNYLVLDILQ